MDVALRGIAGNNPFSSDEAMRSIWQEFVEKAETYNEPGRFTAMTGFEWSSSPKGDNLHRVVVLRDGAEKTSTIVPWSMFDSVDPEGLWDFLARYEDKVGGQGLAIPHNGNLSNGLMFSDKKFGGKRMTREYAAKRARWEPAIEVSQIKGDEEAHPLLSIWYGVLYTITTQIAYMTPPFGYNLFLMRAMAPPEISLRDIYGSILPFVGVMIFALILIMKFPEIALWLPQAVYAR